jgi:hypothetical protein
MSTTLKYLLWRNSSTFQAFLNATGQTQPINLGIGYVVGITGDCHTHIPLSVFLSIIALEGK